MATVKSTRRLHAAARLVALCATTLLLACVTDTGTDTGVVRPVLKKKRAVPAVPVALDAWARVGKDIWRSTPNEAQAGPTDDIGFLVSLRERGDFRFSVDYFISADTNSGVFIRCRNPLRITPGTCYEINIWDQHPKQAWRTGSVVTYAQPVAQIDGLERWVRLEIEARGTTIKAWFDGVQTVEFDGATAARGRIALQYGGGGRLRFRNPSVVPLEP
ncbi:MAG: DUF1080 domain-containing protein [Gammaproteobacteria bacterium]